MEIQKLTELSFELETLAMRIDAQHHASMDTVLALYHVVSQLRALTKDIEMYRRTV